MQIAQKPEKVPVKELPKEASREKNGNGKKFNQLRCLGPVPNLEEHVHPDWWKNIFNSFYLKTDADVVDDSNMTRQEIDMFVRILNLSPEDKVLDLCCGQGRHSLELAQRGFKFVEGIDRSHYLIQKARQTAKKDGIEAKFREGDARKLPYPPDTFDVVLILGNSFGYFETINDDLRVLKEAFRVLKPWDRVLIDVADGTYLRKNFQSRSWEWIDKSLFVCRERSLSLDGQSLISREVITHVEKGVLADQFYDERLYTKETLTEILRTAGFSDITVHGEITTDSARNQDLGMMERRLIITAAVKKEWTPVRRKQLGTVKNVAVMLGDPNKPDPLKPSSIFDEDDFYTIDQLKSALREFGDYRFVYLNDHNALIADLTKLKGKIDYVFNLCDEGFNNDARKELNVPALLEILGIPYTGSGPQCLAHCYDKSLVRGIAKEMGIPVPKGFFVKPQDKAFDLSVDFPVIIKPNFGDSSFGITQSSVANTVEELINAIAKIRDSFGYDKPVLVEEFLNGKEITVGIIGNPPESYTVLPIIEEDFSSLPDSLPRICGYEAKWVPDSPYWGLKSVQVDLPDDVRRFLEECCLKLFERLECKDYCRFDWRFDLDGNPKLLEVNPNPGWCWDGHLAKMAKFGGLNYKGMLEGIIKAAETRLGILPNDDKREKETAVKNYAVETIIA
ncbi:MAG: methyltransferase domain-containing protein [Chitinivibrionales bacterium]